MKSFLTMNALSMIVERLPLWIPANDASSKSSNIKERRICKPGLRSLSHACVVISLTALPQALCKRKRQNAPLEDAISEFNLIASLLPSKSAKSTNEEDDIDSETEHILREATLLLLRLKYAQSQAQLENLEQELGLLLKAPPSPPRPPRQADDRRSKIRGNDSDMWKLDVPRPNLGADGKGPLLDSSGKVRPNPSL